MFLFHSPFRELLALLTIINNYQLLQQTRDNKSTTYDIYNLTFNQAKCTVYSSDRNLHLTWTLNSTAQNKMDICYIYWKVFCASYCIILPLSLLNTPAVLLQHAHTFGLTSF